MMLSIFELHPQLEQDTALIMQLPLCQIRLMNNSCYQWLILVPARKNIVEVFDLSEAEQYQLQKEISLIAQKLKQETGCDKVNIAALGNVVPQLHVHIIARFREDPDWPRPVWGGANVPYADIEQATTKWKKSLQA